MFFTDAAGLPPDEIPALIAHASDSTTVFTKTLRACEDVEHKLLPGESPNQLVPAFYVLKNLGYFNVKKYLKVPADVDASIKVGVLQPPKHGRLAIYPGDDRSPSGGRTYGYAPDKDYLGKDQAVFWVEVLGKRYRVTHDMAVMTRIQDNAPPACKTGQYVSVPMDDQSAPGAASNDLAAWQRNVTLSAFIGSATQ